jgi:hypothetical protein
MIRSVLMGLTVAAVIALGQSPGKDSDKSSRIIENGSGLVGVNPAQPYRPIPLSQAQARETIFEFYLRALNPHQVRWGDLIDQRLAVLAEQSIGNPYFRICAFQTVVILVLLTVCWLWWDKLRQVKAISAESLADALNARALADAHALEAIEAHNRHMDACNRVIEAQESGNPSDIARGGWRQEIDELRTKFAREQAENARLTAALQLREEHQTALDARISQLEVGVRDQHGTANAELVARLQRAESQLGSGKAKK